MRSSDGSDPLAPPAIAQCLSTLRALVADRGALAALEPETRRALCETAARVASPDRIERRRLAKAFRQRDKNEVRDRDRALLENTGIRKLRRATVFSTEAAEALGGSRVPTLEAETEGQESAPTVSRARSCYICKAEYRALHFFYDSLCPTCGDFNYGKRNQTVSLDGRVALITGARVKIGYQAALKLLRAGARVVVTTRFPRDAALRFSSEPSFSTWRERLTVYGLDLRHTPSVERFTEHLVARVDRLDFIINNACQTVRRPSGFYQHLMEVERTPLAQLSAPARTLLDDDEALRAVALAGTRGHGDRAVGLEASAELSQVPLLPEDAGNILAAFPPGALDQDLQQVDLRTLNSWRLPLAEVSTVELLEVQLVNAIAPFILNARLKPLMLRHRTRDKHIVNVSAMEGQFYRTFKTDKHPHTNMAKAALNMLTRTSASDYAADGIFMNSVDTGWVTDEDPAFIAARKAEEQGFSPPLDIIDGAARIVAPIFDGLRTGRHAFGMFFKDYAPTPW